MNKPSIHDVPEAIEILTGAVSGSGTGSEDIARAGKLARLLQERGKELQTKPERQQQEELDRMIQSPQSKVTLTKMTDQAFRSDESGRAADQLVHILDVQGIPRFFSPLERGLLKGFQTFGRYLPGVAIPFVKDRMRKETANVILPAEQAILRKHLDRRSKEGVRMNVNFLGEAVLGEDEAKRRFDQYFAALSHPEIEVVSVKISTIFSQIHLVGREKSIVKICQRLSKLYEQSTRYSFTRADGSQVPKFIYLDMEEYRDLVLTAEAFMRTLDQPEMKHVRAGIVLQAYIPDSFPMQKRITEWARNRVQQGGSHVTVRIVKGANMEMERFEASVHGWPQAPFRSKLETDANYKQMVQFAMQPENRVAVKPGIASHNLFDISYALVLTFKHDAFADVQFEMLEGMANHQRRALHELTKNLLLYAPACEKQDFIHAIGYLVRRLDENTGEENFLRHAFNITVNSPAWDKLEKAFQDSFDSIPNTDNNPRRTQNRSTETFAEPTGLLAIEDFDNEPDTDFSLPENSEWAEQIIARWKPRYGDNAIQIPLFIGDQEVERGPRDVKQCLDPSRPGESVGNYAQATADDAMQALQCAKQDPHGWRSKSAAERQLVLRKVAHEIRKARGDLMGAALADGGKTLLESDPEVSEAVDFCEYYAACATMFESLDGVQATGKGVVVVVSPWNFPIAIPCGGIAAGLAAGNTVIIKPASHTVLVAHELCECFYRAGVPRTALQFLPCSGGSVGQKLVAHEDVDVVILTGGTSTALQMLEHNPQTRLLAETGGKNATIVTAISDRDQAIKHIVHSAFGHCGQKCSATSLLLLEDEVFDDENFRKSLVDAVNSLQVGSAWELDSKMGPLIAPPDPDLMNGLSKLDADEEWALESRHEIDGNPCLYSPCIKWGVEPGSYTHKTEFFGPSLGVVKFKNLEEAIEIVNQTGYGLTSGLESLDDREHRIWKAGIRAGNLYINRPTTGAIVLRQPFGGMGKSAFGPNIKAGGPNYVAQLMDFRVTGKPAAGDVSNSDLQRLQKDLVEQSGKAGLEQADVDRLLAAIASYDSVAAQEFRSEHDDFKLIGQDNIRKYLPIDGLCVRCHADDSWFEVIGRIAAAIASENKVCVSCSPQFSSDRIDLLRTLFKDLQIESQSEEDLIALIKSRKLSRLRYADSTRVPVAIRQAVVGQYIHIADSPVIDEGRVELCWYFEEQSLSCDYHRYGNLLGRANEQRRPTL